MLPTVESKANFSVRSTSSRLLEFGKFLGVEALQCP